MILLFFLILIIIKQLKPLQYEDRLYSGSSGWLCGMPDGCHFHSANL